MKKVVLIDVDGVIANSARIVYEADVALLRRLGREPIAWEDYRTRYVTRGDFERDFGILGRDEEWLEVFQQFEHLMEPYQDASVFISKLKRDGFWLGIVSAGSGTRIRKFLVKYSLEGFFDTVVTREDLGGEEKEKGISQAINNLGAHLSEAVYVGDTQGDYLSARNVGIDFIGVSWGLHHPDTIRKEGNCVVVDDFQLLYEAIKML